MSLGLALSNAVSALKLNQQSLAVLSNNIANVNTPGYSRKIVDQSAIYIEGQGSGVQIDDITRKIDTYLQRSVQTQTSATQRLSTVNDYYQNLQALLGSPGSQNSLDEYMTTFFNGLQSYADQPELTSARSNLVNAANTLAGQVSGLAQQLESLRFQADNDISSAVDATNTALKKLYDLNTAIARAAGTGQSTAGLLDERDTALQDLAKQIDISTFYNPNGTVTVSTGDGAPVVDGNLHQLQYLRASSVDSLIANQSLSPLVMLTLNSDGEQVGQPYTLVTGGTEGNVTSTLSGGAIQGLQDLRDNLIPDVLDQLDMLASRIRDSMNTLQNKGTGFPPATSLTGDRSVTALQQMDWSGSVRIAVLQADGSPVPSPYSDEAYTGIRPLTLDLSALKSGDTSGTFTMQTLVDEINSYYGAPGNKAEIGNLNNIQIASNTDHLPSGNPALFNFDLDLDNISADPSKVFVTGMTVRDDTNSVIPNAVTQDAPSIALSGTGTYTTYAGENYVDVKLASTTGLNAGDTIYLGAPGVTDANGIAASDMTGYFTIESVSGNTIRINTQGTALTSGAVDDSSGVVAKAAYATVDAGDQRRTTTDGNLQLDLTSSITSAYYTVTMEIGVVGDDGTVHTGQVTYKVPNGQNNTMNDRYSVTSVAGGAALVQPTTTQAALRATLVDANGNELPKVNGQYVNEPAYLKITSGNSSYTVSIDEMDSSENGDSSQGAAGTGWGFSHYFGLNDFFDANDPTATGDTVKHSALNLAVQQRLQDNPNLISAGNLQLQKQPADPSDPPQYTYVLYSGDNSVAQQMAGLATARVNFDAIGGLPNTKVSLQDYTGQLLGYVSSLTAGATDAYTNSQQLLDGFTSRAQAVSGVNLDEELANTIIFQNAYSASARLVSIVDDMFKSLIDNL